ncbi:MAG: nucleotidyl transferase AbiEii/AbiGii toxin family protein [Prevotellaceae bacterium]|jgi:predicted nucleotidyltransferase component of viral defense system|nr:nucleotidyl transferase AbiEii/AbiGii toxin family protein [Prevotellaceae bacterium]
MNFLNSESKKNHSNGMNFNQLTDKEKVAYIEIVSQKTQLEPIMVEKDVWVTAVLRALFELPYAENISFKGGTSLSKCWDIIQRFSEDVDIAINREYFGFQGETFTIREISKKLRKACCKFCRDTLQYDLAKQMIADGILENLFSVSMNITDITTIDPEKIFIEYKSVFGKSAYIKNVVVLEINGRSMKEPLEKVAIQSFIDKVFAEKAFAEKSFEINVVAPERTFLEKVCLLHEEFAKQDQEKIRVNRMSRHLYDIARMLDTPIAEKALNNNELYKSIIAHRRMFQAIKDFDYDTLLPATISIIPPKSVIAKWADDYSKMQTMIYGESPLFETMIDKIKQLNMRINRIVL